MDEVLGQVEDNLLDALFSLEDYDESEHEEFAVSLHWAIKDVISDIKKFKEENQ